MATIERISPQDVYKLGGGEVEAYFTQVVVASDVTRIVHIAGTYALDLDLKLIGPGSMRQQVRAILHNIDRSVAAAGGTRADIVRTKMYTTDFDAYAREGHAEWLAFFGDRLPASTGMEVCRLGLKDALVEIEAYALI